MEVRLMTISNKTDDLLNIILYNYLPSWLLSYFIDEIIDSAGHQTSPIRAFLTECSFFMPKIIMGYPNTPSSLIMGTPKFLAVFQSLQD